MTKQNFEAQKSLARAMDRCAARSESVDREPATQKQCWYLAGLILAAGEDGNEYFTNFNLVLTKRRASREIDAYANH